MPSITTTASRPEATAETEIYGRALKSPRAQDAADRYVEAGLIAESLIGQFHGGLPATRRAQILFDLAVQRAVQAETTTIAYGYERTTDPDPRPLSSALRDEAVLISALAATEHALATGQPRVLAAVPALDAPIAAVLDELATASAPADRFDLIAELYEPLEPLIGDQTARQICELGDRYALTTAQERTA
ncbi:hypothetical protein [Actinomadura oligospora]|uniref:hypothetical protein n=1 Tax=Actinomadura oligospora TaxID=111804 RepID=UPI00047E94AA|nr:hypothetical protein [Actinomadura oligospora]